MAFTVIPVIGANTNPSASGTASLGTNGANKFAVLVTGVSLSAGTTSPSFSFTVSWDGSNFVPVQPQLQRGNVFVFDCPAANVGVAFGGNGAAASVVVTAYTFTD